jgi:hypothetical protein
VQQRIKTGQSAAREEYGEVTYEEVERPRRQRPPLDQDEDDEEPARKRRPRRERDFDDDREDDDRPRKKRGGMKNRQAMKLVNLGLGFHYVGLVIVLVGLVGALLMPLLLFTGTGIFLANALNVLLFIAVGLVVPGLWIAGSVLCLFVPPKSGGYSLILASVILNAVAIVMLLILWIVFGPFALLGCFASLAAWICFMLFLRALAGYIREHGCADEALQLLVFGIGLIVGTVLFFVFLFVLAMPMQAPPWLLMGLSFVGGISLLVLEIKFLLRNLQLIGTLRQAIVSRS